MLIGSGYSGDVRLCRRTGALEPKGIIGYRSIASREMRPRARPGMRVRSAHTRSLTHRVSVGVRHRISAFPRRPPFETSWLALLQLAETSPRTLAEPPHGTTWNYTFRCAQRCESPGTRATPYIPFETFTPKEITPSRSSSTLSPASHRVATPSRRWHHGDLRSNTCTWFRSATHAAPKATTRF